NPRRITLDDREIVGAVACRIDDHADRDAGPTEHHVEQMAYFERTSGAHVVRPSRHSAIEDQLIRSYGVANVRQITERLEIPHLNFRDQLAGFNRRDRARECRRSERWILARSEVIEWPRQMHDRSGQVSL